tara:strand:- start:193 stop:657 length:465 start_codon:yes stop_codon:yes gene_type:complete
METFTWTTQFRDRVRLLAGIDPEELDNDTLDILANMSAEWFQDNTGLTYTLNSTNAYDMAVVYYTCYLGCLAQNGVGIDRITVGDLQVYYDTSEYEVYATLANQMLAMQLGLSIKRTSYNAAPFLGNVNWKENVTGINATKDMYPPVRGVQYDS